MRLVSVGLACVACVPLLALAQTSGSPFSLEANARLRVESVDDAAFPRDADATTLRLRLGVRGRFGEHWSALLEGEGIAGAGTYDSGADGPRDVPTIADPDGAELNQALVAWKSKRFDAAAGRQRMVFGNQRWVGNVGWRQNEQTFDALSFEARFAEQWKARYAFFDKVHRVNGDDARDPLQRERDLATHAFDIAWTPKDMEWRAFALLHEDKDVPTASTATYSLRGTCGKATYEGGASIVGEIAQQHDHADNPLSFSHDYWLLEPAYAWRDAIVRLGIEHLGGDGKHALQTPLATLHAFNGWADKFAGATPPGGLDDRYASVSTRIGCAKCEWILAFHDYQADTGSDYGSEWNASFAFPIGGKLKGLFKLADYRAEGFARDTTKLWVQVEWQR